MNELEERGLEKIRLDLYALLEKDYIVNSIEFTDKIFDFENQIVAATRLEVYGEEIDEVTIDGRKYSIKALYPEFRPAMEPHNYVAIEIPEDDEEE